MSTQGNESSKATHYIGCDPAETAEVTGITQDPPKTAGPLPRARAKPTASAMLSTVRLDRSHLVEITGSFGLAQYHYVLSPWGENGWVRIAVPAVEEITTAGIDQQHHAREEIIT